MKRNFSKSQREAVLLLANSKCEKCGIPITINNFHADHIIPFSEGGKTVIENAQALCAKCNLTKGKNMIPKIKDKKGNQLIPREWQKQAFKLVANKISNNATSALLNVCPGGGKTKLGVMVAKHAIGNGLVDKVIIISPRGKIRDQWADDMTINAILVKSDLTQRRAKGRINNLPDSGLSATYQIISYDIVSEYIAGVCNRYRTLVIMDEIHWTGRLDDTGNAWGRKLIKATENAKFCLALSGTPFREDHYKIPFLAYEDGNGVADYDYSYGEALDAGAVTPIYFKERAGSVLFKVVNEETGEVVEEHNLDFDDGIYYKKCGEVDEQKMNRRLNACLHTTSGYWRDLMDDSIKKLDEIRSKGHRNAGGIVFAVDQNHARSIAGYIAKVTGINPHVIISDESNDIDAFASSSDPWVVSVKMISEGVDIERLRVGVVLTNITTRKNFMQSVARCIRIDYDLNDDAGSQSAYIFMPPDPRFQEFAIQFKNAVNDHEEDEPAPGPKGPGGPKNKKEYIVDSSESDFGGMIFGDEYYTAEEIQEQAAEVTSRVNPGIITSLKNKLTEEEIFTLTQELMRDQRKHGNFV